MLRADDAQGARARHEAAIRARLDAAATQGVLTLHGRRAPGLRGVLGHVVVGPAGVFVLDARCAKEELAVAATAVARRAAAVRAVLDAAQLQDVPVTPVLCLPDRELPNGAGGLALGEVRALPLNRLSSLVSGEGRLEPEHCATVRDYLAGQLPAES